MNHDRPNLIDLYCVAINYYPFMIGLGKCTGSCNVISPKICFTKETKYMNVKAFNMITNKTEAKQLQNIIHVIKNINSIARHVIQIKI